VLLAAAVRQADLWMHCARLEAVVHADDAERLRRSTITISRLKLATFAIGSASFSTRCDHIRICV